MTEEEAIKELAKAEADYGMEQEHISADQVLVRFLEAQGYHALSAAYYKRTGDFWYA